MCFFLPVVTPFQSLSSGSNKYFLYTNKISVDFAPLLPGIGKRKFDGGHQNQGDSKRRYQSNWGNQPLTQQPLGAAGVNGEQQQQQQQWYQDSYGSWS